MKITKIEEIGNLVKQKRKEMAFTQKQAAGFCNVGTRFFSELENGKPSMEIGKVLGVLRKLGLETDIHPRGAK